ncbi:thiol-disulfide isomerase/thioredoxin [Thermonema lapsum]|uniref:Thiol-disulfide isomerase/thioredoxin n=1 Tax=Thermonema lapsum TaxID=28195 RepID=A0A846MM78_9BACT|nr:TlpA disulfide reductase family protein [Thermonema lapsum]NIK72579.1 thiol-disulfide isomerase/thioredoxin [Thermonema lapsum]
MKNWFKKIPSWLFAVLLLLVLYSTGTLPSFIGGMQRLILWTGLMDARPQKMEAAPVLQEHWQLQTADGRQLALQTLKGKVLVINLWATWCPPCVAELPGLRRLQARIEQEGKENIHLLLVNIEEQKHKDKVLRFAKKKDIYSITYFPLSPIPALLQSKAIPATFVFSPSGQLVYRREGMANYDNQAFWEFLLSLE